MVRMAWLAGLAAGMVLVCGLAVCAAAETSDDIAALRKQIQALAQSKNYPELLKLQRELVNKIEAAETASAGKAGPKTAGALGGLAWHALLARDFAGALAASERATELAPDLLWLETNKAHALLFLDRQEDARVLYLAHKGQQPTLGSDKLWEDVIEADFAAFRTAGLDHPAFDMIIRELGIDSALTREFAELRTQIVSLRKEEKTVEALPLGQRNVAVAEKRYGAGRAATAEALNDLAMLYQIQGHYADAEPLYKRSLAVWEKALGPDHPDVAAAVNNLAALYQSQGRYADAEPLLQARARHLGEGARPRAPRGRAPRSTTWPCCTRPRAATPRPSRSTSAHSTIREKALGPDHPHVAQSLNNLAVLYQSQGRYAEAEPLYKRALAIREKALGPEHPDVAAVAQQPGGAVHGSGPLR